MHKASVQMTVSKLASASSKVLGVAESQIDLSAEPGGAPPGEREQLGAELDRRQRDPIGIEGQVPSAADRDLEDVAPGLLAGPLATAREERPVAEVHLAVVARGLLVHQPANALGLHAIVGGGPTHVAPDYDSGRSAR